MKRSLRRYLTQKKLSKRIKLISELGLRKGLLFAKHREKIIRSPGYMRDGNIAHYAGTTPSVKTRSRNRYGKVLRPPKRDLVKLPSEED